LKKKGGEEKMHLPFIDSAIKDESESESVEEEEGIPYSENGDDGEEGISSSDDGK
jgi:hypothetical protein